MLILRVGNHVFSRVRNRFVTCEKSIYHQWEINLSPVRKKEATCGGLMGLCLCTGRIPETLHEICHESATFSPICNKSATHISICISKWWCMFVADWQIFQGKTPMKLCYPTPNPSPQKGGEGRLKPHHRWSREKTPILLNSLEIKTLRSQGVKGGNRGPSPCAPCAP